GASAGGVPGPGGGADQPAPRDHPEHGDGGRVRDRERARAAVGDVRLLDGPPLRDAGQGRVLDGVRKVSARAESDAGADDQGVPGEAGSSEEGVRGRGAGGFGARAPTPPSPSFPLAPRGVDPPRPGEKSSVLLSPTFPPKASPN